MRNRDVDWKNQWITIRAQNAKDFENRNVPFEADGRLAQLLQRRCFLGPDAYIFGTASGERVGSFRTA
jgi:hypothetical protein